MTERIRRFGTVAGPHPKTARAGMAMLRAGGNAVDAAVAAAFTEGVVEPLHNGIAGYGGCMVIYLAGRRRVVAVDCNSTAPAAASEGMFTIEKAPPPAGFRVPGRANIFGPLAVGVPGVVAGLCLALRRYGTMPLAEVVKPAISAARFGYVPGRRNRLGLMENAAPWRRDFPETARLLLKDGRPPRRGSGSRTPSWHARWRNWRKEARPSSTADRWRRRSPPVSRSWAAVFPLRTCAGTAPAQSNLTRPPTGTAGCSPRPWGPAG